MLKGLCLTLTILSIVLIAAATVPIMHVVSVYREWNWDGGPMPRTPALHS